MYFVSFSNSAGISLGWRTDMVATMWIYSAKYVRANMSFLHIQYSSTLHIKKELLKSAMCEQ